MGVEWRLRLPDVPAGQNLGAGISVRQGYIVTSPGELRLRQKGDRYCLTIKSDVMLIREKREQLLPQCAFEQLWVTESRQVEPTRYTFDSGGDIVELDVYTGSLTCLVVLECEFAVEEIASRWRLPEWAFHAVEVTQDTRFKNRHLAAAGLP